MVLTYSSEGIHSLLQTVKSPGPRSLDERDWQFVAQASLVPSSWSTAEIQTCCPLPSLSFEKEEAEATRKEALKYKLMG